MQAFRHIVLALSLGGLVILGSCTKHYLDYNTDPNGAVAADLSHDNLQMGALVTQMEQKVIPSVVMTNNEDVNDYQLMYSLAGDIFSGQQGASNSFGSNGVNSTAYDLTESWTSRAFSYYYRNIMAPWFQAQKIARQIGQSASAAYGVILILKVMAMHRVTDMYGPLPYINFQPAVTMPYDGQNNIYQAFFKELDSATTYIDDYIKLNEQTVASSLSDYDLIYKGDLRLWLKLAASLKLRLAMRTVYVNEPLARQRSEEAIKAGVIENSEENAVLKTDLVSSTHPLWMIASAYNDTRMGATMQSILKGYKDPRLQSLFEPATELEQGGYYGVRGGISFSGQEYAVFSKPAIKANSPIEWLGADEVYFLRAEGALRGWEMGGSAQFLYEKGIRLAMERQDGDIADKGFDLEKYLKDGISQPAPYIDPKNPLNNYSGALLSKAKISYENAASFEQNLERIITQKWIALYPDGQEAWSEYRRTGYPRLIPIAHNLSGGVISTSRGVRRLPFPRSEYQKNSVGVQAGVRALGGPDNGATQLWWDRK